MTHPLPVYIGDDATQQLIAFCEEAHLEKFLMVCDQNTYPALGMKVEAAIHSQGWDLLTVCLTGDEIIADAHYLMQVLTRTDSQARTFLAVGSGTITDISRFISFKTNNKFISLPTAASVDGFTSIGAPLVVGGVKITYISQAPIAVFADLPTLCQAPQLLSASGFGDLIGKLVSSADWQLGHVLWDEPYDPAIDRELRAAALNSIDAIPAIRQRAPEGISRLMAGLINSGFCMLNFGSTNPASGAEHHISHYWEHQLLLEKRPAILHGIKVGLASIYTAGWYEKISQISQAEVKELLKDASFGSEVAQIAQIRATYGETADEVMVVSKPFISMSAAQLALLKQRIVDRWDAVQAIAAQTPGSAQIKTWLQQAGAPVTGEALGFSDQMIHNGLAFSHYLRRRFTINKLRVMLSLPLL